MCKAVEMMNVYLQLILRILLAAEFKAVLDVFLFCCFTCIQIFISDWKYYYVIT